MIKPYTPLMTKELGKKKGEMKENKVTKVIHMLFDLPPQLLSPPHCLPTNKLALECWLQILN